jgi:hypothetical protein
MKKSTDKRNFLRIDRIALVSYEIFPNAEKTMSEMGLARTVDLSVGGIQLELPRPIAVGDGVKLVLNLEGNLVPVAGRVTRVESGFGGYDLAGIRLTRVATEYATLIGSFVGADAED